MATVTIQKRKISNGIRYLVSYRDPYSGKKKHYKSYSKYKDAQEAVQNLRSLIDHGKLIEVSNHKNKVKLLKFFEVSQQVIQNWRERQNRGEIRPVTFCEYETRANALIRIFGNKLLCEITKDSILKYQENVYRNLSAISANRDLFILKQIFKFALSIKAIIEDNCCGINYLSEKAHERNKFLLPDEVEKIIEASNRVKAKYYMPAIIYLGAEHGASKQEILSLEWSDIRFDYNDLGIIRFFRTKNGHERTEFIMPRTKAALILWRSHITRKRNQAGIDNPVSNKVFTRIDGRPIDRFSKAWRAVCKLAGYEDLHFHDLRHTFCSNLLLAGSDLKDVKEMIGHSDLSMTDRYSHLTISRKRKHQEQLARHYSGYREGPENERGR